MMLTFTGGFLALRAFNSNNTVGVLRGGGDTRFVLFNDMIFMWGLVIPSAALSAFVFHFPPLIVFCCLKADQILKCFVAVVKVNRYTWIRELAR